MSEEIECIGGPYDGELIEVSENAIELGGVVFSKRYFDIYTIFGEEITSAYVLLKTSENEHVLNAAGYKRAMCIVMYYALKEKLQL